MIATTMGEVLPDRVPVADTVPAWLDPDPPGDGDDWSRTAARVDAWLPQDPSPAGACRMRPFGAGRVVAVLAEVDRLLDSLADVADSGAGSGVSVNQVSGVQVSGLDGDTAAAVLVGLVGTGRRLAGVAAAVTARFAASGTWAGEGFRSVPAWLTARTTLSRSQAGDLDRMGARATAHPVMAAAVAAGAVDPTHLNALAEVHRHYPRLSAALRTIEPEITGYAATVDPATLTRYLTDRLHRIDPDAVDDADRARLRRDSHLTASLLPDGYVKVSGLLPPELGTGLRAALDAATRIPDPVDTSGTPVPAEPAPAGRLPRRTRNLAALTRILTAAAAATGSTRLPDVRGTRPVVHVTIPLTTLAGAPGATGIAGEGPPTGALHDNPAAVTIRAARRLACDADIRRLLVDPDGLVLDVGRTTKVISAQLRIAVTTRDGRCRFPGCQEAIDEIHHLVHWADGGRTDRRNLLGLCWFHHHDVHHGTWALTGDADHEVTFAPGATRTGTARTSRPRC